MSEGLRLLRGHIDFLGGVGAMGFPTALGATAGSGGCASEEIVPQRPMIQQVDR